MKIRIEFKLQDMWIGVYWQKKYACLHIWICLVPCFPIHIIKVDHTYPHILDMLER
jgi:hypothetical protein